MSDEKPDMKTRAFALLKAFKLIKPELIASESTFVKLSAAERKKRKSLHDKKYRASLREKIKAEKLAAQGESK